MSQSVEITRAPGGRCSAKGMNWGTIFLEGEYFKYAEV